MKRSAELLSLLLLLFVCLCSPPVLFGQTETGSIAGQVHDPQGAAVVGADVTVTNTATGVVATTKTNETGSYYFPSLRPSQYKLSVKATGFKESVLNVDVHVQDRLSQNISLAVGSSSETVDVNASAEEVSTSSSVSTEVSVRSLRTCP